ncbi:S8 family serine peptidase, partial [Cellulomonas cellasea]|uniref:S8 family serine peptidase n=1 Tax=Cellulomonas cellasea TaxID=43670 RepID=UPI001476AE4A
MSRLAARTPRTRRAVPGRGTGARSTVAALALSTVALVASPVAGYAAAGPVVPTETETGFTVQVDEGRQDVVRAQLDELGITPTQEYDSAIDGFAIDVTPEQASAVEAIPEVATVRPENVFTAADSTWPMSWGVDRIDQPALPLDSSFTYPPSAGAGVRVYVLDTGVDAAHESFTGRVEAGFDVFEGGAGNTDCAGHGTHVAGIVASNAAGIAIRAHVVPVRVLDCAGTGDTSTVLSGVEWVLDDHEPGTPAVVNLSLGGPADPFVDAAVEELRAAGLFVTVAAGNAGVDACAVSPARTPGGYTVGATTRTDARWASSNWGPCVDLFAPGAEINSMLPNLRSGVASGTSQAAPHVAGAAALYLGEHPGATAAQVEAAIDAAATPGVVTSAGAGSTTALLSTRSLVAPAPEDPLPPTGLRTTRVARTSATVVWDAPLGGPTPTDYRVWLGDEAGSSTLVDDGVSTTRSVTLTGLQGREYYFVRVETVAGERISWASPALTFLTSGNQAPVGNFEQLTASGTSVTLSGWAVDPDVAAPIDVHFYVNGAWGGSTSTTRVRTDVAAAYPGTGNQHGFSRSFTAGAGTHQVCAYAIDTESAASTPLGCRSVTVAGPPA